MVKNLPLIQERDPGYLLDLIPGSRRSFGEGSGNPLQYSYLENPTDRGAWQAITLRVANHRTRLKVLSTHTWGFLKSLSLDDKLVDQADSAHTCVWKIGTEV